MKRIVIHWTAGTYYPSEYEKLHYHFLVDKCGVVHSGKFKPEDNEICKPKKYAMHTGGGNTGSIGVAICAMAGFKNKNCVGNYPILKKQFESTMKLCAELANKYKINVTPQTVFTHYEFGQTHPKTTSATKIDFTYLPYLPNLAKDRVGDYLRNKIQWYILQQKKQKGLD